MSIMGKFYMNIPSYYCDDKYYDDAKYWCSLDIGAELGFWPGFHDESDTFRDLGAILWLINVLNDDIKINI